MGVITVTTAEWFAIAAMLTIPTLCYAIFKFIFWLADRVDADD